MLAFLEQSIALERRRGGGEGRGWGGKERRGREGEEGGGENGIGRAYTEFNTISIL